MSNALRVIRPKHARRNELKPPIMVSCPPLRIYLFGYMISNDILYSYKKIESVLQNCTCSYYMLPVEIIRLAFFI